MSDLAPTKKLTKKEKKAQAFRSSKGKGKSKNDVDQAAVPEEDDLDQAEDDREAAKAKVKVDKAEGKKRKRVADEDNEEGGKGEEVKEGEAEEPKKKKRQRGKKQNIQPGVGADGKARLVLFVGNLPYKVTVDDIKKHFEQCGEIPAVRLLTPKPNPASSSTSAPKSKGCAFIEFTTSPPLQAALRLHEAEFQGRKINVELTAGGGGNSAGRTAKIEDKRKMMLEEREKVAKNKREREGKPEVEKPKVRAWGPSAGLVVGEGGAAGGAAAGAEGELKTRVSVVNGKKVRDRRIPKTDASGVEKSRVRALKARADKASSGSNATPLGQ